jgi:hypothetical protein
MRLIEAKDYMNPAILGILNSVLPTIRCSCGYSGLPIQLTLKEYHEWVNGKDED